MYITANTIITLAAIIGALITIFGVILSIYRWYLNQNQQTKDIEALKKKTKDDIANLEKKTEEANLGMKREQTVICYALLACLDGLNQLGANGNVSEARKKLEKHLNMSAHE